MSCEFSVTVSSLGSLTVGGFYSSWLVLRDFSTMLGAHANTRRAQNNISSSDFGNVIMDCNLCDIPTRGALFNTWSNDRGIRVHVEQRLDRALSSTSLLDSWTNISCYTLPCLHLYHNLLIVSTSSSFFSGPKLFRFHSMLTTAPTKFKAVVATNWFSCQVYGDSIYCFIQKLIKEIKGGLERLEIFNIKLITGRLNWNMFKQILPVTVWKKIVFSVKFWCKTKQEKRKEKKMEI